MSAPKLPSTSPAAPEGAPEAPAASRRDAGEGRVRARLWGIVDLLLLLAVAAGAAFYAVKETLGRHRVQVVDRPMGPLTHIRDAEGAPPSVSTAPPPDASASPGDAPVRIVPPLPAP